MRGVILGRFLALALVLPALAFGQDMEHKNQKRAISPKMDTSLIMQRLASPLQVENCFGCVLGIWDDAALTSQTGTMAAFTAKDIYLGIKYAGAFDGLTGIELSISGIRQTEDGILVTSVTPLVPASVVLGGPIAPADTSATSSETGGMNIAWASCLTGDQALVKITLLTFSTITNKVLEVKHKYPPSNPEWHTPIFVQCDAPTYTATRVTGGCFGLNFTGTLPCAAVNQPPVCDAGGPYTPPCTSPTTTVNLDGSGSSDPDPGTVLTFRWTTNCTGATIVNPTSAHATLQLPTPVGSGFNCLAELTVSDGVDSSSCSAPVTVTCPIVNRPPVCDAGGPYSPPCTSPTTTVNLDASGSSDPDPGTVLTFRWTTTCVGGTILNPTSAHATLLLPTPPGAIFNCAAEVTVSDGIDSSSCRAPVTVNCSGTNRPPVCDAGGPYVTPCTGTRTSIALDGTGSHDPDGDKLTYAWSSTCPGASFDDPTSAKPVLTVDTSCCPVTCTAELTVSDGKVSTSCTAPVTFESGTGPPAALVLWPPDHKYVEITPEDCLIGRCAAPGPLTVQVLSVRSDEPEDATGNGDGATLADILITCPAGVQLRAERQGAGNGRVYTIVYGVTDATGTRREECKVSVPHDQSGVAAVEGPGPGYEVVASCGSPPLMTAGTAQPVDPLAAKAMAQSSTDGVSGVVVSFVLSAPSPVVLDVFDIAGRRIRTVRTDLPAGPQQVRWDGRDASGREVASGIYVMQLRAQGVTQRAKTLWVR